MTVTATNHVILGWYAGSSGSLAIVSGTVATPNTFYVGYEGTGVATQRGGAMSSACALPRAKSASANVRVCMPASTKPAFR